MAAAVAPTIGLFIVARALSGTANAFLTPLLLAGLAEVVPRGSLGRAVGTFAAVQTAAIALAPAVGGVLGEIDWRLAFVTPAAVAVVLAFVPPPDAVRIAGAEPARLRAVLTRRVGVLSAAAFAGYAGVTSLGFLVALRCRRRLRPGLERARGGAGRLRRGGDGHRAPRGRLVDRFGRVSVTVAGALICAVLVALIGAAGTVAGLTLLWLARRRGLVAHLGRAQHADDRGGPGQPRRGDVRHLGLQIRGERGRSGHVAAALRQRRAPRLPGRRRGVGTGRRAHAAIALSARPGAH